MALGIVIEIGVEVIQHSDQLQFPAAVDCRALYTVNLYTVFCNDGCFHFQFLPIIKAGGLGMNIQHITYVAQVRHLATPCRDKTHLLGE